nr:zinc-binding dehydrogenase [Entomohabitans teleogrylli]
MIDKTFLFEQMAQAHRDMETNGQTGKIVVTL